MEALLVIDVDGTDSWPSSIDELSGEKKRVALAIKETLAAWRREKRLIAFVVLSDSRHRQKTAQLRDDDRDKRRWWGLKKGKDCIGCDLPDGCGLAGFLEHRHREGYEPVFIKTVNDAFTNSELIGFLRSKGVGRAVLAGCQTFSCVMDTAQGAVKNGLQVKLLEQCTYPQFSDDEQKDRWISEVKEARPDARVEIE